MDTKDQILEETKRLGGMIRTVDVTALLGVSRQYASILIAGLVSGGKLVKVGSTRGARYALPEFAISHPDIFPSLFTKIYRNTALEEHKVLDEVESRFPIIVNQPENVRSIFTYAFSEMLNNAIEHSKSKKVSVEVSVREKRITFIINDFGVGVFRNIMQQRHLTSELEAIQELLKGKTTTMPKSHSGEGIFFTSKVVDTFVLESYGYRLFVDNRLKDVFLEELKGKGNRKQGTRVTCTLSTDTKSHLNDVFSRYANLDDESDYGFDKTEILVKLYTVGGVHISRSQARRILSGLEKFRFIVFDFEKVPVVGQAFADEIFRVFHEKHPDIRLEATNMNDAVRFMVERVEGNNPRSQDIFMK